MALNLLWGVTWIRYLTDCWDLFWSSFARESEREWCKPLAITAVTKRRVTSHLNPPDLFLIHVNHALNDCQLRVFGTGLNSLSSWTLIHWFQQHSLWYSIREYAKPVMYISSHKNSGYTWCLNFDEANFEESCETIGEVNWKISSTSFLHSCARHFSKILN